MATICASGLYLFTCTPEEYEVGLPIVVMAMTAVLFWCALWIREDDIPFFEIGSVFMLAAAVYSITPFVAYLLSGMEYSVYSSSRLLVFKPDASQMAAVAWETWTYMAGFAAGYLMWRGKLPKATAQRLHEAPLSTGAALLVLWCGVKLWTMFLKYGFGIDYSVGYGNITAHIEAVGTLPHWFSQIIGVAQGLEHLLPLGIFVFLMSRWRRSRQARVIAVAFLGYTLVWYVVLDMGARTWLFLPFGAAGMMYFRNVRRIRLWMVVFGVIVGLLAFWAFNEVRGGPTIQAKLRLLSSFAAERDPVSRYSRKDEFQLWLSSNYEVKEMRDSGQLPAVPWQIYAVDLLLFIPSQLLPFEKLEPVAWFSEVAMGIHRQFEYFSYSPIAQSYIGLGIGEILLRGLLLGVAFAWIHRSYVRHSRSFWANVIYLWFILFCYGSLRNNSTYVFVIFVLRLAPAIALTWLLQRAFSTSGEARRRTHRALPSSARDRTTAAGGG